jgi:transcriptional regulator GlxA family with amidase domain
MTHICILIPDRAALFNSIANLFKIFDWANRYAEQRGRHSPFDVHLVSINSSANLYGECASVKPDLTLAEVAATDLVIVPALAGNIPEVVKTNATFVPWIQERYHAGAQIAGLCTGVFFLADTGLRSHRHCSVRWFVDATFQKQFSHVNLTAGRTVIDEEATCRNGAYQFIYELLEREAGTEAALAGSERFRTAFNLECQSIVTISDGRKQRAKQIVEVNPTERITAKRFDSMFEGIQGHPEMVGCAGYNGNSAALRSLFKKRYGHGPE